METTQTAITTGQTVDLEGVVHPSHYNSHPSGVECIEVVKHHNFCIGNAIKYLWRQGIKDGEPSIKDLRKAMQYIQFEIDRLAPNNSCPPLMADCGYPSTLDEHRNPKVEAMNGWTTDFSFMDAYLTGALPLGKPAAKLAVRMSDGGFNSRNLYPSIFTPGDVWPDGTPLQLDDWGYLIVPDEYSVRP